MIIADAKKTLGTTIWKKEMNGPPGLINVFVEISRKLEITANQKK